MNEQPIETARDDDLRLSKQAMLRAAQRAREIAARTGTAIAVSENGVLRYITPRADPVEQRLHEQPGPYSKDQP